MLMNAQVVDTNAMRSVSAPTVLARLLVTVREERGTQETAPGVQVGWFEIG